MSNLGVSYALVKQDVDKLKIIDKKGRLDYMFNIIEPVYLMNMKTTYWKFLILGNQCIGFLQVESLNLENKIIKININLYVMQYLEEKCYMMNMMDI